MQERDDSAAARVVEADKAWSVEQHAIEPIPSADRHGTPIELFKLWIGANINYVVVVTGSLLYAKGLTVAQCLAAILVGNLIGCTVVGLCSVMGPKTGSAGIIASRTSFGQAGAVLPMAISLLSALSWFSIQSVIATQGLEELFRIAGVNGGWIIGVSLILVLSAEIALALYGHATIIAAEQWIALVLAALFAGLGLFVMPHLGAAADAGGAARAAAPWTTWLVCLGIVLSYPIGWANFASDYSRYFPETMSWKRIALGAGGGQFVSIVFGQVIGVMLAVALKGALGDDPVAQLRLFLPTWYVVPLLIGIILGGIAANVPNGYTAALGMLALRVPISRVKSLAIIAAFTLVVRVITVFYGEFYDVYQKFLEYLVFWTTPWAAIVITDFFMRRGEYDRRDLMRWGGGRYWYRGGYCTAGMVAFLAGTAASVAFSNSPSFESPLAKALVGGADLSFEMGFIVPCALYLFLARPAVAASSAIAVEEPT